MPGIDGLIKARIARCYFKLTDRSKECKECKGSLILKDREQNVPVAAIQWASSSTTLTEEVPPKYAQRTIRRAWNWLEANRPPDQAALSVHVEELRCGSQNYPAPLYLRSQHLKVDPSWWDWWSNAVLSRWGWSKERELCEGCQCQLG